MWACSFTAAWTSSPAASSMTGIWSGISGQAGDRVDVISLPWRPYGLSLLDNLNSGLHQPPAAGRL